MSATDATSSTASARLTARRRRASSTTWPRAAPPLLDEHRFDAITLAEAGRVLHVSSAHLVRCFTRTFGIAPHRYVVGRRIEAARHRLLEGESVARVATGVGFHDQAHLTRHFRRYVGTTPSRYARAGRSVTIPRPPA